MQAVMISITGLLCVFLPWGNGQLCTPALSITPSEIREPGQVVIRCTVSSGTECSSLDLLQFRKTPLDPNSNSRKVYEIIKGGTGSAFPDTEYGYTLEDRSSSIALPIDYILTVTNSTLEDSGEWQCVVITGGSAVVGNILNLTVTGSGQPNDLTVAGPQVTTFLLGVEHQYTCLISRVYPLVIPEWEMGGTRYSNGSIEIDTYGYVYMIRNTILLRSNSVNDINASCIVERTGNIAWSSTKSFYVNLTTVGVTPILENSTSGTMEVTISSQLILNCVASGTRVEIVWWKGDDMLEFPNTLFQRTTQTISGNFSFLQTTAVESILTWIPPPSSSSALCKDKTKHIGEYKCTANGEENSLETSDITTIVFIHTNACISCLALGLIITVCLIGVIGIAIAVIVALYMTDKLCQCSVVCLESNCDCCCCVKIKRNKIKENTNENIGTTELQKN